MFTLLFWKKVGLSFARAYLSFFVLGVAGLWDAVAAGDWTAATSALVALAGGAGAAGIRAAQALFTKLETPPAG